MYIRYNLILMILLSNMYVRSDVDRSVFFGYSYVALEHFYVTIAATPLFLLLSAPILSFFLFLTDFTSLYLLSNPFHGHFTYLMSLHFQPQNVSIVIHSLHIMTNMVIDTDNDIFSIPLPHPLDETAHQATSDKHTQTLTQKMAHIDSQQTIHSAVSGLSSFIQQLNTGLLSLT